MSLCSLVGGRMDTNSDDEWTRWASNLNFLAQINVLSCSRTCRLVSCVVHTRTCHSMHCGGGGYFVLSLEPVIKSSQLFIHAGVHTDHRALSAP